MVKFHVCHVLSWSRENSPMRQQEAHFNAFLKIALAKTVDVVEIKTNLKAKKIVKSSYHERVKQIKKKHVNAYKVWTNSEELELLNLYKKQSSIVEIAKRLNRQVGGIKSRLRKLGLIN